MVFSACGTPEPALSDKAPVAFNRAALQLGGDLTREQVAGDVYHYSMVVRVGNTANAKLRLHRVVREQAPFVPRPTHGGVMMLHGDFANFVTNFAPAETGGGLAAWLAARDMDVWGVDRRWTLAPAEGADLSDFGDMGVGQELDDIGRALTLARSLRLLTGSGGDRLTLLGFSHGAQLAYLYAAVDGGRPAWQQQIKALVPLDIYATIAPEDAALRQNACDGRDFERELLDSGEVDSDNSFFIEAGSLAQSAPSDPSPLLPGRSNQLAVDFLVARTYQFFAPTPLYHLAAGQYHGTPAGSTLVGLRESPEPVINAWLAHATPHQSLRESFDLDSLWCGQAPLPPSPPLIDAPLANIHVPLFYLGAAGGFGDHGRYTTTQVSSTDVTTLVVRRLAPEREVEDYGHGDLLYGTDAPTLAWQPLLDWLRTH